MSTDSLLLVIIGLLLLIPMALFLYRVMARMFGNK